ncbi:hypothetical protein [Rhizobium leguminosarum]|uniref:Restriction endonuclease n=1 Tax=Rhizobium leguminosarum TaxID=384 RepID=A0A7K3VKS4_RHILE|nr:hypothetical protein [Rhizobium leguminosarum]NEK17454.1 hypothetical protein [Rhizobium leguminosarum]
MDTETRFSYRDLMLLASSPSDEIRFRWLFATSHLDRRQIIEDAVDSISAEFAETPQHRKDRSEDGLTIDVVTSLKHMGFQATHDEDIGGHCDIVVRGKGNFLWLAEAKIHKAYDWLAKGYQQITTRYSTGMPGQDAGALVIYCKAENVKGIMDKWREHFAGVFPDAKVADCATSPLSFVSTSTHPRSGLPFRIRHIPISVWHEPKEGESRKKKAATIEDT